MLQEWDFYKNIFDVKVKKKKEKLIFIRVGNPYPNPESAQFLANFGIRIRNPFFIAYSDS